MGRGGGGGGGKVKAENTISPAAPPMQLYNLLPQSLLSRVNLFHLKFSVWPFGNKFYDMKFWLSLNAVLPLKSLIGIFPNMAWEVFLTNGGDVSTQISFKSAIVQVLKKKNGKKSNPLTPSLGL